MALDIDQHAESGCRDLNDWLTEGGLTMSSSEKIAIAAHLHVLMRRKTGRVTDTEWMATDPHYAHEIARLARENRWKTGMPTLAVWADKLEDSHGHCRPEGRITPEQAAVRDAVKKRTTPGP